MLISFIAEPPSINLLQFKSIALTSPYEYKPSTNTDIKLFAKSYEKQMCTGEFIPFLLNKSLLIGDITLDVEPLCTFNIPSSINKQNFVALSFINEIKEPFGFFPL